MESAMPPSLGAAALALLVAVVVSIILLRRKGSGAVSLASPASVAGGSQGLAAAPVPAAPPPARSSRVLIVFATQTGTAERFAKSLRSELESRFGGGEVSFEVAPVEKVSPEGLSSEKCVILLMATYGDGEPTDDAVDFHESLMAASRAPDAPSSLRGLSHAVFALGNRQYEHFCAVGLQAHAALARLGSSALLEAGTGDDDADIDEDFERWTATLASALEGREDLVGCAGDDAQAMGRSPSGLGARGALQEPGSLEVEVLAPSHASYGEADAWRRGRGISAQDTVGARVMCVRELHSSSSRRSCVHVELDLGDSSATYCAGDHAGVLPGNSPALVARAAARLGFDLTQVVLLSVPDSDRSGLAAPSSAPLSVRQVLTHFVDLCGPPGKSALAALAWTASDKGERTCLQSMAASSPEGRALFHERVVEPKASLLDLLEAFPSARPSLGMFVGSVAARLAPRYYSISSSSALHPRALHLTALVVREPRAGGRLHEGVASSWLARCRAGDTVRVFVRPSNFKLPADPATPVVMVGPGTGLAPFRGFLQERQAALDVRAAGKVAVDGDSDGICCRSSSADGVVRLDSGAEADASAAAPSASPLGAAHLFFGCRHEEHDFIYADELRAALHSGALSHLHVAFSRAGSVKDYVQHHMERHAQSVWDALWRKNGVLYVCGDASAMARDVHKTLIRIAAGVEGISEAEAEGRVKTLAEQGRYLKDVW